MASFIINGAGLTQKWGWVSDPASWRCNATMPSGSPTDPDGKRRQVIVSIALAIAGQDGSKTYSVFAANSDGGDRKTSSNYTVGYGAAASLQPARSIPTKKVSAGQTVRIGLNQVTSPILVGRGEKAGINIVSESPSGFGWSNYSLYGRVYYQTLPNRPGRPSGSGDESTPGVLSVSWSAPSDDGDSDITGYLLQYSKSSNFTSPTTVEVSGTQKTLSGLDEGDEYYFRVAAENDVAIAWGTTSDWSSTGSAVAPGSPSKAAKASFTPVANSYVGSVTVALASSTPSSTIYYTTNGATPTTGSSVYSTPLTFTSTTTLKTLVVASGYTNSDIGTSVYTIVDGYHSNGSTWDNLLGVQVSDGTNWVDVGVEISNGTAWVDPA